MNTSLLTIVNAQNAPPQFEAGNWQEISLLLDEEEMIRFLDLSCYIFNIGKVVNEDLGNISKEDFFLSYKKYISLLKEGKIPDEEPFTLAFTKECECLYALHIEHNKFLIKIAKPVIQMLPHRIRYSSADRKFRSKALGTDAIFWGIHISFPQLFQNPNSGEIEKTLQKEEPNSICFRDLQRWARANTLPVRFHADGETMSTSIRLGKQCYSWINDHPQLRKACISVIP